MSAARRELQSARIEHVNLPDGTDLPVRIFATVGSQSAASTVVLWPGLGVAAGYFDLLATRLAEGHINVVIAELRGQGASRPRPSRDSRFGQQALAAEDVPAVLAVARRNFPGARLFLMGHSMGGQIVSMAAARLQARAEAPDVAGLILVATGVPYYKLYRGGRGMRVALGSLAMHRVARTVGFWPGTAVEGYGRQSRTLIRDWTVLNRHGRFAPRGGDIDYEQAMADLDLSVFAVTLGADADVPRRVTRALTGKFARARVEHQHVPGPLGHNDWARDHTVPDLIIDWIQQI